MLRLNTGCSFCFMAESFIIILLIGIFVLFSFNHPHMYAKRFE